MSEKPSQDRDTEDKTRASIGASNNDFTSLSKNSKRKRKRSSSKKLRPEGASLIHAAKIAAKQPDNASKTPQHVSTRDYPYPTDYNDHFETPLRAYTDILPLVQGVMDERLGTPHSNTENNSSEFTIYDPYFCTGRAKSLLEQAFGDCKQQIRIKHEMRDFYKDLQQNKLPEHDILVTNPPYSGNHKERCLEFAVNQLKRRGRPFFLLMPNYVASKEYFRKVVLEANIQTLYVAPSSSQPYEYDHPEGTGHETPPFQSVWFCGMSYGKPNMGASTKTIQNQFIKFHSKNKARDNSSPRIAASLQELIRAGCVSGEKRKNPRQRKKMRQQAMQKAYHAPPSVASAEKKTQCGGVKKANKSRWKQCAG